MSNEGVKMTTVKESESEAQYWREGFAPVCRYGKIAPEDNEIGGIFLNVRNPRLLNGIFVQDATLVERIFVVDDEG